MNEQDQAAHFGRELDALQSVELRQPGAEPAADQGDLEFARWLLAQDYSRREAGFRLRLRHHLVTQITRKEIPMRSLRLAHRPALLVAVLLMAVVLTAALAWPAVPRTIAQGVAEILQTIHVGPFTEVSRVAPAGGEGKILSPAQVQELKERYNIWSVSTPIGEFGGNLPLGQDATVLRFQTVDAAQAVTPMTIRQPAHLPAGYTLRELALPPMKDQVFLFYDGPAGDIVIVEAAVGVKYGPVVAQGENQASQEASVVADNVVTDAPITPVAFDGRQAAWIEDGGLRWEADGRSYAVGGADLSLEEALRIAGSLK